MLNCNVLKLTWQLMPFEQLVEVQVDQSWSLGPALLLLCLMNQAYWYCCMHGQELQEHLQLDSVCLEAAELPGLT